MLAVYFGCHKFHKMIYGHKINMYTDHQPLVLFFKKEINKILARLQRFKLGLLKYEIELSFFSGEENLSDLLDPLSRLYLDNEPKYESECNDLVHEVVLSSEKVLIVSAEKQKLIESKTKEDPCLFKILELNYNKWDTKSIALSNNAEIGKFIK